MVAVKVVDLLDAFSVFVDPVAYLRQGVVGIRVGIDIGIPVVRVNFLQQMTAVPDEVSALQGSARSGEFVLAFFGKASAERVVGVCPDFSITGGLFDFGADELVF